MTSSISYKGDEYQLCDDFIDIGYMAENFSASDFYGKSCQIQRSHSDGAMTLLLSFPDDREEFFSEMVRIDSFMSKIQVPIYCYFIFSQEFENKTALKNRLQKFEILFDSEDEFGEMYGVKIISGDLETKFTKSLFLISKDGAIFYLDIPTSLETPLDLQRLQVELNKAYVTYTGTGCHA